MNTIIIGHGYVASAFERVGFPTIGKDQFYYNGQNFDQLIPLVESYTVLINCLAKTNTTWTEQPQNFKELWLTNVKFVQELSDYCVETGKKLVHISTIDLYGNEHDVDRNNEDRRDLDINTDYRFSKYASERMCNPQDLILRIRLPYDDQDHPKNLLTKIQKFTSFYHLKTGLTYLPDLVSACQILLENDQSGIFNIESETDTSLLYIARNLLELPNARDIPDRDDPRILLEFDNRAVHNVANIEKLLKFYKPTDLDSSIINCFNRLTTAV
jgi:nucleoside-diphosphate-sugar epimerase